MSDTTSPLGGIRVIGCTQFVGSTRAATILAELGADVIKIEGHRRPDPGRTNDANPGSFALFPDFDPGKDWWNRNSFFNAHNRGQRSLTLDLTQPRGREIFRGLVRHSDVVIESFTPRVMAQWGLAYDDLVRVKPDLIMASLTGFGHGNGPYTNLRGTATVMEATHGHCHVTGYAGDAPSKASSAFVDYVAAWAIVFAVAGALRDRARNGRGQWIDVSLYQAGVMLLSEFLLDYEVNGREGGRIGNRHPARVQGCYPAKGEDEWITLSAGSDAQWMSLCGLMNRPDLTEDERFATLTARLEHQDALDAAIAAWTREHDKYSLFRRLQEAGIPAAPVLDAKSLHQDPHLRARGLLDRMDFQPERAMEPRLVIGHPWKFGGRSPQLSGPGPRLGEHNREILAQILGLDDAAIAKLEADDVIGSALAGYPPRTMVGGDELVRSGRIARHEPDYRRHLAPPAEAKP